MVAEAGKHIDFVLLPLEHRFVGAWVEELDGHVASKRGVDGMVNPRHAARAYDLSESIPILEEAFDVLAH